MDLQGDEVALYLSGQPVPVVDCNIIITQPTIRQIVAFKESQFLYLSNLFGKTKIYISAIRAGNFELEAYSDFQILMVIINQDKSMRQNVLNYFELITPNYKVEIDQDNISFFVEDHRVGMINPYNYDSFSQVIQNLFLFDNKNSKEFDPANAKAAKIVAKLKKRQEQLAKIKGKALEDKSMTLYGSYTSILAIAMNIDINILFSYTPFQISNLFNRYWKKNASDFYQRVSTMPMLDVSKMEQPADWTESLYQQ